MDEGQDQAGDSIKRSHKGKTKKMRSQLISISDINNGVPYSDDEEMKD
jgi:hypothetical protein